jgi:hypothetical protein
MAGKIIDIIGTTIKAIIYSLVLEKLFLWVSFISFLNDSQYVMIVKTR